MARRRILRGLLRSHRRLVAKYKDLEHRTRVPGRERQTASILLMGVRTNCGRTYVSTRTAESPLITSRGNSGLRPNWKFLEDYEWENGATTALVPWNRQGFEYVKWLQESLNHVLKLKLVVDGLPGARTMGAIQAFQRIGSLTFQQLTQKGVAFADALMAQRSHRVPECDSACHVLCKRGGRRSGKSSPFRERFARFDETREPCLRPSPRIGSSARTPRRSVSPTPP
jgi:hypothetical protein